MKTQSFNIIAISKYIRISPTKITAILQQINQKPYKEALSYLKNHPQKASLIVGQTLLSAIANAENNLKIKKEKLIVKEAFITQGPILKRMQPRAKGRAFPIHKKMSHLTIKLIAI
jgi:large subunit ribosomal protein L22